MRFCQLVILSALALGAAWPRLRNPRRSPPNCAANSRNATDSRRPSKPAIINSSPWKATRPRIKVLKDKRLNGIDLEAAGHFTAPDHFMLDPNHARTVLVHKNGKLKMITYWCDVCSIRSYEPGPCWCCQAETVLDLRDPDEP